jgi:hypothetical protein
VNTRLKAKSARYCLRHPTDAGEMTSSLGRLKCVAAAIACWVLLAQCQPLNSVRFASPGIHDVSSDCQVSAGAELK